MRRCPSPLWVALVGCAVAPKPLPEAVPLVVTVPPATARVETDAKVASPRTRVVATQVLDTFRLGPALFVSFVSGETHVRVARVADDGTLTDVAPGMPPSHPTTTRAGGTTLSGTPSALLGEPEGPVWMAFTHYSVFGGATMYRAEGAAWRCVGRCPSRPDPERWSGLVDVQPPSGERTASGDVLSRRSRGHLFRIENRVSGEGTTHVLPRATMARPAAAVAKITTIASDDAVELADGSIVDVAKHFPDASRFARVDGRSADDFWVSDEASLVHVQGAVYTPVPLPAARISSLRAEADGTLWVSAGAVGYQRADDGWRALPFGTTPWREIAAARPHAVFVVVEDQLVRIEAP